MKFKHIGLVAVLSLSIFAVAGCSDSKSNDVVASLDGEKVTKEELYDELVSTYGNQIINTMLVNKIAVKEAKKLKFTISDKELEEGMSFIDQQYGSVEEFEKVLKASNTSMKDVEEDIKTSLLLEKVLKERVKNTDEELQAYFKENQASFGTPEQVQASHILVATKEEADDLVTQLKEGADFAELAKEHSTDSGSAIDGGNLGLFGKGTMTAPFEEVAFSLEVGKISEPVKTEFGYHIIKVTDKKEGKAGTFEENKEAIEKAVSDQKLQDEYTKWMDEKFKEYNVNISLK